MPTLRRFQKDFLKALINQIETGQLRDMVLDVAPGGGKSLIPKMALKYLRQFDIADCICWIVPRLALMRQSALAMLEPTVLRGGEVISYRLLESRNDIDPANQADGYLITYASISSDVYGINADEFLRKRYVLVSDECHHLSENGATALALQGMVANAAYRIWMSGTLQRHDDLPIAYLPYTRGED